MKKKNSKRKKFVKLDENLIAFDVASRITKMVDAGGKNPAAVALGRLGGLKGGKARAQKLSKERRREIASMAASKRWGNKNSDG